MNQVLGDGIMALFGAPLAHEDHAVRACYAALAMQAALRTLCARRCAAPTAWTMQHPRRAATPEKWWCGPSAMTCTWTTRPWGRPRTWRRVWNSWRTPGSILLTPATLRLVGGLVQVQGPGPSSRQGAGRAGGGLRAHRAPVRMRRRLQAARARGSTRFVGAQHGAEAPAAGPGTGRGRARPGGGRGGRGGRGQVAPGLRVCPVRTTRRAGWCSKAPRCRMARRRRTSRCIDLLRALYATSRSAMTRAPSGPR